MVQSPRLQNIGDQSNLFEQLITGEYSYTSDAIKPSIQLTPYLIIHFIIIAYHSALDSTSACAFRDLRLNPEKVGIFKTFS